MTLKRWDDSWCQCRIELRELDELQAGDEEQFRAAYPTMRAGELPLAPYWRNSMSWGHYRRVLSEKYFLPSDPEKHAGYFLLAFVEGVLVGSVRIFVPRDHPVTRTKGHAQVCVLPANRGEGLGAEILLHALDYGLCWGRIKVWRFVCDRSNLPAQGMLRRVGAEPEPEWITQWSRPRLAATKVRFQLGERINVASSEEEREILYGSFGDWTAYFDTMTEEA